MITSAKNKAKTRRLLSGWTQLRNRSRKLAADLALDISDLTPLFDKHIDQLTSELHEHENIWRTPTKRSMEVLGACPQLGTQLIAARILLDWSQQELADRAQVAVQTINRYEKMRYRTITLAKAIIIAEALMDGLEARSPKCAQEYAEVLPDTDLEMQRSAV